MTVGRGILDPIYKSYSVTMSDVYSQLILGDISALGSNGGIDN